jgi:hypothetical protein
MKDIRYQLINKNYYRAHDKIKSQVHIQINFKIDDEIFYRTRNLTLYQIHDQIQEQVLEVKL